MLGGTGVILVIEPCDLSGNDKPERRSAPPLGRNEVAHGELRNLIQGLRPLCAGRLMPEHRCAAEMWPVGLWALVLVMLGDINLDQLVLGVLPTPEPLPWHRAESYQASLVPVEAYPGYADGLAVGPTDLR